MIYLGIDDTDTLESRGTGALARSLAEEFSNSYPIHGVTRHQLFIDPRIPYTAKNSCAALHIGADDLAVQPIFDRALAFLREEFIPGSDPGLAVGSNVPTEITAFGERCKRAVVSRQDAYQKAEKHQILLEGIGGTFDGVIGALSAVGLAAGGNDGRFIISRQIRELEGLIPVEEVYQSGVDLILEESTGNKITTGALAAHKLRPSLVNRKIVLYVIASESGWFPLRKD